MILLDCYRDVDEPTIDAYQIKHTMTSSQHRSLFAEKKNQKFITHQKTHSNNTAHGFVLCLNRLSAK